MFTLILYLSCVIVIGTLELLCYESLFVHSFRRKPYFLLRVIVYILSLIVVLCLLAIGIYVLCTTVLSFDVKYMEWIRIAMNFLVFIGSIGVLFFCFEEKPMHLLYAAVAGKAANAIFSFLYSLFLGITDSFPIYVALLDPIDFYSVFFYIITQAVVLLGTFFLFGKPFAATKKDFDRTLNIYTLMIFAVMLCFAIFLQGSNSIAGTGNSWVIFIFNFFGIVFCFTILFVLRFMLYWIGDRQEKEAVRNFHENYKKQSEITRQSMELVNIKCHDLKHQIAYMLTERNLDSGFLEDVKKTISIYDANVQTGNENLDVILMEKSLCCEINHIQLTAMVDGKALNFMSNSDMNSLFGNALDNAIESLLKEDVDNRFIRVSTHCKGDLLILRIENFFSGSLNLDKHGFPFTSKNDNENHGFGVRSIKAVAEKYGGTVSFGADDNLFVLSVLFAC